MFYWDQNSRIARREYFLLLNLKNFGKAKRKVQEPKMMKNKLLW